MRQEGRWDDQDSEQKSTHGRHGVRNLEAVSGRAEVTRQADEDVEECSERAG